jgi:hypothetical protein
MEMREFQKRLSETKRKAAAAQDDAIAMQSNAQEQAGSVLYGEQLRQETRESAEKDKDRATKIITSAMKSQPKK